MHEYRFFGVPRNIFYWNSYQPLGNIEDKY